MQYDSVRVPGGTRLVTVARATGADSGLVDQLNPHYLRDVTPREGDWYVRIPQGLRQAFANNFPRQYRLQRQADMRVDGLAQERAAAHRPATHHRTATRYRTHHRH